MTKAEFIERIFRDNRPRKIPRVAIQEVVDGVFETLAQGIQKDGKFTYPGFGAFVVKERKARSGRNPKTGEPIVISARKTIGFRVSPHLKQSLR